MALTDRFRAMGPRRLVFLLFLYVTLDFTNPFMPGAVRFDVGGFETVHADRVRPAAPFALVALVATPEKIADPAGQVRASGQSDPIPVPRRRAAVRIRRMLAASSDSAAPSEDH
jgi:hypothetical protein